MDYEELAEKAADLRQNQHYNCAQSAACALTDGIGLNIDHDQMKKVMAGYAGGMATMEATCGALIGAVAAAGIATDGNGTVMTARSIQQKFIEKSGAIRCRDLKGIDTGKVLCPCEQCVKNAVLSFGEVMGDKA
ncbi:MAG: C-GCAxxG-C-C family protein [Lachnospiraceae bacterium]|jgi:C_GCAxxG_C_C family probable redox protein|nr:C-GCAxxG-C-C family protein [Lachnospiraceae bacterium]MEE3462244.1 C-GCAxxG-C-C family protein [Lachnospiraceae bacterium]